MKPTSDIIPGTKMSIFLLGAGFTTGNMGVAALASGTIASLYYSFPKAKIFIMDYSKTPANYTVRHPLGETKVELVSLRYTKRVFLPNSIVRLIATSLLALLIPGDHRKKRFLKRNPYLAKLNEATWVVSIAGGDSFSDIYGFGRLLYVALPQLLALLLRKPLIQLPQTHGPFKKAIARWIARFLLLHSSRVFSRDRASLSVVEELTKGRTQRLAMFAFDMGFAAMPIPPGEDVGFDPDEIKKQGTLVGLNVSGLLYIGGYNGENMFGLKCDYRTTIQYLIKYFMNCENVQVLLVPHVL